MNQFPVACIGFLRNKILEIIGRRVPPDLLKGQRADPTADLTEVISEKTLLTLVAYTVKAYILYSYVVGIEGIDDKLLPGGQPPGR